MIPTIPSTLLVVCFAVLANIVSVWTSKFEVRKKKAKNSNPT
jgi:membrane protein CcdC involved in cytochrome C biogenesis